MFAASRDRDGLITGQSWGLSFALALLKPYSHWNWIWDDEESRTERGCPLPAGIPTLA